MPTYWNGDLGIASGHGVPFSNVAAPLPRVVSNVDVAGALFRRLACASIPGCSRITACLVATDFAESALAALPSRIAGPGCTAGGVRAMGHRGVGQLPTQATRTTRANADLETRASGSRSASVSVSRSTMANYICGWERRCNFRHQRPAAGVIRRATSVLREWSGSPARRWCSSPSTTSSIGCRAVVRALAGQDETSWAGGPEPTWRDRVSDSLLAG